MAKTYSYRDPNEDRCMTMISEDVIKDGNDKLRTMLGNVWEYRKDLEESVRYEGFQPYGDGFFDHHIDEYEDIRGRAVARYTVENSNYVKYLQMATSRIQTIDQNVTIPNIKIPIRLYADPETTRGDQFWKAMFAGGEYGGQTYESLIDTSTVFYDIAFEIPVPYSEKERKQINKAGLANNTYTTVPEYVYYNSKIGEYITWASELESERLIPNLSIYESLAEAPWSYSDDHWTLAAWGLVGVDFQLSNALNRLGDANIRYITQYDIGDSGLTIESDWKEPLSPFVEYGSGDLTGKTVQEAKTDLLQGITRIFGRPEDSSFHRMYLGSNLWLPNTASAANYLRYMAINQFSGSTLDKVNARNENVLYTYEYWRTHYWSKDTTPDNDIKGFFPYYVKINFPMHIEGSLYTDISVNYNPREWYADSHARGAQWFHEYSFTRAVNQNRLDGKFLEVLKDIHNEDWTSISFGETTLQAQTHQIKSTTTDENRVLMYYKDAKYQVNNEVIEEKYTEQQTYRSIDFINLLASIYNNPSEALNENYIFAANVQDTSREAFQAATYDDIGIHRYINSSASIGTIADSVKILEDYFSNITTRQSTTDSDGSTVTDIDNDKQTLGFVLEPHIRHMEPIAYRVEKVGGSTTGDQTNKNIIQNFWAMNYIGPNWDLTDFMQFFDTQVKYAENYTYNAYAYALVLGHKYKYGDFRLTRQLSTYEDSTTGETMYCLEFYDPLTMERADQQFHYGGGLKQEVVERIIAGMFAAGTEHGWTFSSYAEQRRIDGDSGYEWVDWITHWGLDIESIDAPTEDEWREAVVEYVLHPEWAGMTDAALSGITPSSSLLNRFGIRTFEFFYRELLTHTQGSSSTHDLGSYTALTLGPTEWASLEALVSNTVIPGEEGALGDSTLARLNTLASSAQDVSTFPQLADFNLYIEPCLKLIEIPMFSKTIKVTDNPANRVNTIPFQHVDASDRVGFHAMYEDFWDGYPYPTTITTADLQTKIDYLNSKDLMPWERIPQESKSKQRYLEVYRIDQAPESHTDFENNLIETIDLRIGDTKYNSSETLHIGSLQTNKKYYYVFRFLNELRMPGQSSSIYQTELVDDGGYIYALFDEYVGTSKEVENYIKPSVLIKKLFQIEPNISQTLLNVADLDYSRTASEELGNVIVGEAADGIWNKEFKLRLTSKKTGKKIDINVTFMTKDEDRFTVIPSSTWW